MAKSVVKNEVEAGFRKQVEVMVKAIEERRADSLRKNNNI